ncbi:MAG TPA: hypothetical protein VMT29_19615 [Steroidobacteraceae bacterium]|nr:hypothetical protein [Steroidobacteraceae bacterium]
MPSSTRSRSLPAAGQTGQASVTLTVDAPPAKSGGGAIDAWMLARLAMALALGPLQRRDRRDTFF